MKASFLSLMLVLTMSAISFAQQDKSQRASPPDSVKVTTDDGVTISINYSRPSLKGRQIGVDIVPFGKVWRTGANEATTFEVDKGVLVDGHALPAGKYSLYSLPTEQDMTIIFNKVWDQWGTRYDQKEDALRVVVMPSEGNEQVEQFTIKVGKNGAVTLLWGQYSASFVVKSAN